MDFDAREMRNALGRFATGVCVISAVSESGESLGLTANSFASVSLDPPLVLWSLQNNSDVFDVYSSSKHYAINILASEHEAHSNRYAKKGEHILAPEHFTTGKHGSPIIRGALISFECELHATHEGGDHLIIVGKVVDMHSREAGDPLLFYSGGYRRLS
jgi:flavin reductase (DIM6/NTAB) family NADH-FMN oxidoreductase RutF